MNKEKKTKYDRKEASDKKVEDLQNKINSYKNHNKTIPIKPITGGNMAYNIAVELTAGVIVGVLIGLFFDKMFDSKPAFLIICLMLSITASFKSIWNKYIK